MIKPSVILRCLMVGLIAFLSFASSALASETTKNNVVDVKDLLPQSVIDNYKA